MSRVLLGFAIVALVCMLAASVAMPGPSADAGAPAATATNTLVPTPTSTGFTFPIYEPHTFVNSTGSAADALDVTTGTMQSISVWTNAPGCSPPTIQAPEVIGYREVVPGPTPTLPYYAPILLTRIRWPSACIEPGESVTIQLVLGNILDLAGYSFPSSRFFDSNVATLTPTRTPTPIDPTATPTPFPGPGFAMAIDCDVNTAGVQSSCNVPLGSTSTQVDVVLINNGPPADFAAFNLDVSHSDPARLDAPSIGCSTFGTGCNPDFFPALLGGTGWTCAVHVADHMPAPGDQTILSCNNNTDPPVLANGEIRLATIFYDIPFGATPGAVPLSLLYVEAYAPGAVEIGSCNPVDSVEMFCLDAVINLVEAPTFTPTSTATVTATPTSTATFTPTPLSSWVHKVPEGNAANADPNAPKANLWLCEQPAPCAGPGEGSLRVVERAENVHTGDENNDSVEDGLGAYEFTVEYDNFVIASVNPCDLVFGPGGAGASRGPVEELPSSANPDCDTPLSPNGSCAMSLILENLVHFGCVTGGQTPGPTGDFDLASLNLIPHEDLANDLFPGNNNGVLTVVKDNGCELVDVFGHPVTGSVNGGLVPACGNLAVTVRILEGDLDLDCDVDVTDAQAIAARYGAFFGGLLYSKWHDLEPQFHDLDIDIKDVQKVFGRDGSTCQAPIPAQPPL